eukprot:1683784-Pyramimonas_sp.AAC.1
MAMTKTISVAGPLSVENAQMVQVRVYAILELQGLSHWLELQLELHRQGFHQPGRLGLWLMAGPRGPRPHTAAIQL